MKAQDFNADLFVLRVQMMHTETLALNVELMRKVTKHEPMGSFSAKLACEWVTGVYEREARARGLAV